MENDLQNTLDKLIESGSDDNPALNKLISDYTTYHLVLVVLGGLFCLVLALLGVYLWKGFRRTPTTDRGTSTFERRTYFYGGISSITVSLLMTLIVAANLSNVLNPRRGFAGTVNMLATPPSGSQAEKLQQAFNLWLQSGERDMPSLIQSHIDDRLAWQRPKAIICGLLLVIAVLLCARLWRSLVYASAERTAKRAPKELGLLALAVGMVVVCLVLMLMVIGNTQGSFAPISLTLIFG